VKRYSAVLVVLLVGIAGGSAFAAGPDAGDFFVRVRPINVDPQNNDRDTVKLNGQNLGGAEVKADDRWTLGIDVDYMLTRNLGLDLMLDTTSDHDVQGAGSLSGLGKIASAKVLPPALLLNYYFFADKPYRPYLGAGIGYAIFFDEDVKGSLEGVIGKADLDMEDTVYYLTSAGIDYDINDHWFVNANVKVTWLESKAKIDSKDGANKVRVDVNIDPIIYGVGIGYRF